jgi:hypothetical protein
MRKLKRLTVALFEIVIASFLLTTAINLVMIYILR